MVQSAASKEKITKEVLHKLNNREPREEDHIGKLLDLFPIHAVLTYPVSEQAMQAALQTPA